KQLKPINEENWLIPKQNDILIEKVVKLKVDYEYLLKLQQWIKKMGIEISDIKKLGCIFVHHSYTEESKFYENHANRMASIGESILHSVIGSFLYNSFQNLKEGMNHIPRLFEILVD